MSVFNEQRTYGIEMEINTELRGVQIADQVTAGFERDGIGQVCTAEGLSHGTPRNW